MVAAPAALAAARVAGWVPDRSMKRSLKSTPRRARPSGGMRTSSTSEVTIFPNAAPRMTATARSRTFPRSTKALNSLSTRASLRRAGFYPGALPWRGARVLLRLSRTPCIHEGASEEDTRRDTRPRPARAGPAVRDAGPRRATPGERPRLPARRRPQARRLGADRGLLPPPGRGLGPHPRGGGGRHDRRAAVLAGHDLVRGQHGPAG